MRDGAARELRPRRRGDGRAAGPEACDGARARRSRSHASLRPARATAAAAPRFRAAGLALDRLRALDHPLIAEARGRGLFFGLELTHGDGSPATLRAAQLVETMRSRGILLNRIGRHMNTVKMRPPMPFSRAHADLALDGLTAAFSELPDTRPDNG